jgi:amino acid transporter
VIYAFARDGGMPLSNLWKRVDRKHSTPAPAIWLSAGAAWLVAISSGAFSVVTSMSTVGLYISYIVPVYLGWRARRNHAWVERGPWHLGRWSNAINLIAIAWTVFICWILVMPPNQVAGETMLGVAVLLAGWYFISERARFKGAAVENAVSSK